MKKITSLLLTAAFVIFLSCNQKKSSYEVPKIITVTGKVDNYDPNLQVSVSVKRIGLTQDDITAKIDSAGNFIATFESYIPLDVVIGYKTNFWVLLHPGDSLFVQFDGKYNNRPELLSSIDFKGNRAKTNQYAAKFQQMYFSNEYSDSDKKNIAVKEYDVDQYLQYLDTIHQKSKELYNQFVAKHRPDDESKEWALLYIEADYYNKIGWYAGDHRQANNMNWNNTWDVPKGFYDKLLNRLPIEQSMFISAYALSYFCGIFDRYVTDNLRDRNTDNHWGVVPGGGILAPSEIIDSICIFSTIEFVHDPLLRQLMLTRIFDRNFEKQNITAYEQFQDVAAEYIKEPFLKEPLYQKYLQVKSRIENPQVYTEALIREATNLSVNQIVDDILQKHRGKVIYVDFWATWCGPCLAELPNSKIIEHEFEDKDVVFIYICLESDEKLWKASLDKFQLGGQHYLLSNKQSAEIRKLFEIGGIPFYLLIDKNGVIKEKGNHLRPLEVKNKVVSLLK